jgi:hypothetical protein
LLLAVGATLGATGLTTRTEPGSWTSPPLACRPPAGARTRLW